MLDACIHAIGEIGFFTEWQFLLIDVTFLEESTSLDMIYNDFRNHLMLFLAMYMYKSMYKFERR